MNPKDTKRLAAKAKEVSRVLQGLAHPVRLRMLCRLCDGPASVKELQEASGLSQAGTSQFLARLRKEGHVEAKRKGRFVYYTLRDSREARLIEVIGRIYCKSKDTKEEAL